MRCVPDAAAAQFYMYEQPELNHKWLRHCARYKELRYASKAENTAEVGMHKVLARHPLRTRDPALARLFYVPIFEYTSKFVGAHCANSTTTPSHLANHSARMHAAWAALVASPYWRAHGGRDHAWATTAFSAHSYTLEKRMVPLSSLLGCSIVGRYKAGPFARASAGGSCVIEVPYQASLLVTRAAWLAAGGNGRGGSATRGSGVRGSLRAGGGNEMSTPGAGAPRGDIELRADAAAGSFPSVEWPKPTLLFFAGSLDVRAWAPPSVSR